jgi:hypothetical protein
MIDGFVILTPILLLAVVALLGFVGCDKLLGLGTVSPMTSVMHVQTVVKSAAAGTNSITADPLTLQGGEFIVVAVQWSTSTGVPSMPELSETTLGSQLKFTGVSGGGPFAWYAIDSLHNMMVQIFSAGNPTGNTQFQVKASLLQPSTVPWNLCVSAYSGVNEAAPLSSPQTSRLNYVGNNPQTPPIGFGTGALIYSVGLAANSNGTFPGNNALTAGAGFTAEFPAITNPLVQDGDGASPVIAQVTNANPDPNAKGFIFAVVLNAEGH